MNKEIIRIEFAGIAKPIIDQRMREYKLKSKNSYELYYSRKIGKSSYMGMEQVSGLTS